MQFCLTTPYKEQATNASLLPWMMNFLEWNGCLWRCGVCGVLWRAGKEEGVRVGECIYGLSV